ncbi:sucrase/ferredoxin domain-containing protein [Histoplasma capsulatum G186AR]|uniref:Defect at low temperature protein 1 n=2 Tax=Ajellomyces capsulatus TaxID=5037 RepID=C0NJS6_AJECG|nr:sucrase/ferredoxin domain-containing protein [Histoplasma capsulatum G186AR]EEH08117.1 sucrase/ferredoxin domain-containing protein [Histoplasma capsulatum G186AR]KAG5299556.1 sucrase/ferredoxin domain-containing protein [Histoplasma capsulatum]QSS67818.1 sucrase/ferredoxin domain-containing protein [Histoplasma capsulatum G186AR]
MLKKTRLSRVFYTTFFTVLAFIFFILTLLTPADTIYQSSKTRRLGNVFIVSGVYIITLLLAILIYASRIFTNRSVLAGIPKPWIPVEKPDVPKSVRRLVVKGLSRSAIIAQQSRPRDRTGEDNSMLDPSLTIATTGTPPWGHISHPGWTAPDCPDMHNQEFEPVIKELPHLIEAKAVSFAPMDPRLPMFGNQDPDEASETNQPIPDERIVEILRRPGNMSLRDYVNHLIRLNVINPPDLGRSFVRLYERGRFADAPLTEPEFRSLLGMFAELLRGMSELDPEITAEVQSESSIDGGMGHFSNTSSRAHLNTNIPPSSSASFTSSHQSGTGSQQSQRSRFHPSTFPRNGSFILDRSSGRQSLRARGSRTPSAYSLPTMASDLSAASSAGSVIHHTHSQMS